MTLLLVPIGSIPALKQQNAKIHTLEHPEDPEVPGELSNFTAKILPILIILLAIGVMIFKMPANKQSKSGSDSNGSSFTNQYGTPTTKCAHKGCNNYIASSGNTNCCTKHSRKCLNCGCYIDEDAMYCMDCISGAIGK